MICHNLLFRYLQALSTHRTDARLHRRIGELIDSQGYKSEAIQYFFDVKLIILKTNHVLSYICIL